MELCTDNSTVEKLVRPPPLTVPMETGEEYADEETTPELESLHTMTLLGLAEQNAQVDEILLISKISISRLDEIIQVFDTYIMTIATKFNYLDTIKLIHRVYPRTAVLQLASDIRTGNTCRVSLFIRAGISSTPKVLEFAALNDMTTETLILLAKNVVPTKTAIAKLVKTGSKPVVRRILDILVFKNKTQKLLSLLAEDTESALLFNELGFRINDNEIFEVSDDELFYEFVTGPSKKLVLI